VNLPSPQAYDWITVHPSDSAPALPTVTDLSPDGQELLALGLDLGDHGTVFDDKVADGRPELGKPNRTFSCNEIAQCSRIALLNPTVP